LEEVSHLHRVSTDGVELAFNKHQVGSRDFQSVIELNEFSFLGEMPVAKGIHWLIVIAGGQNLLSHLKVLHGHMSLSFYLNRGNLGKASGALLIGVATDGTADFEDFVEVTNFVELGTDLTAFAQAIQTESVAVGTSDRLDRVKITNLRPNRLARGA
jgi:hypothetical protein